jgi:hypothetical protein
MSYKFYCELCGKEIEINCTKNITVHLKHVHNIDYKTYYDTFLYKENEDKCTICGKPTRFLSFVRGYAHTCCTECRYKHLVNKTEETCMEKWGVKNGGWTPEAQKKIKKHNQELHGCDFYTNREQYLKTLENKYGKGTTSPFAVKDVKDKIKETNLDRFGVENPWNNKEIRKKCTETRYKSGSYMDIDKFKKTCLERFGVDTPLRNGKLREQGKQNYFKKTGYWHNSQNPECRKKIIKKYKYNDIFFDSAWEIAYYIWLTDNNIQFEYQPKPTKNFKYFWEGDKKYHTYYPDFLLEDGSYIELKNGFLLENMIIDTKSQEHAKFNCIIKNKVKIISDNEIDFYLNYITNKYNNKKYLEQFRYNKEDKNESAIS